ncbi:SIGLEC family-like protein 1 [Nannospalax galili]|uniref:SIGLEC family-like protein 1 n=1 Tax=Nannospalax galili TaxID=1026970 RepID=UPI000819EC66|nr:SIGLEC family-like protein 1 [Nannospalax galili]XP_029425229.1 SIGLEC family-like protein 1 [Nannospalax galili]
MDSAPVDVNSGHGHLQVTSVTLGPWANSTLSLVKDPEMGTSLLCEGKHQHGAHALSILLMSSAGLDWRPGRGPLAPHTFLKAMFQGVVYSAMAITLLFLCLLAFIVKHLRAKWAKRRAVITAQKVGTQQKSKKRKEPEKYTHPTFWDPAPGKPWYPEEDEAGGTHITLKSPLPQVLQTPQKPRVPNKPAILRV